MYFKSRKILKPLIEKSSDCRHAQKRKLLDLVDYGKNTEYGKKYNFKIIETVSDFQKKVPLITYEDIRTYIEKQSSGEKNIIVPEDPLLYALTSGTTKQPKKIPITPKYFDECYNPLSKLWIYRIIKDHPEILDGRDIAFASKLSEGTTKDNTLIGSISGHLYKNMPERFNRYHSIPLFVSEIDDYFARYYVTARIGLAENITFIVTVNSSTLVELNSVIENNYEELINDIENGSINSSLKLKDNMRKKLKLMLKPDTERAVFLKNLIKEKGGLHPKDYWPQLSLIATWRCGNSGLYLEKIKNIYPAETIIREFGYMATEIRAGIVLNDSDISTVLACHLSFFEFIKVQDRDKKDPKIYLAHELKAGERYYIIITNSSGLYRYDMNDIIQVDGFYNEFPKIRFIQKGGGVTNLTGEKLYENQLIEAVNKAINYHSMPAVFFTAYADINLSCYHLYIEFINQYSEDKTISFCRTADSCLKKYNIEYAAKRNTNRLKHLKTHVLAKDSFHKFKQEILASGKRDGQFKLIHITEDITINNILKKLCINS